MLQSLLKVGMLVDLSGGLLPLVWLEYTAVSSTRTKNKLSIV